MNPQFDELKLTGNLPSPSGVGLRILQVTQKENCTAEELAKTIQSDPALTGRILKMANSANNAGVSQIKSVSEAVVRLGLRSVRNVALGFSLVSSYRKGRCEQFDFDRYWSESLARAVAAQKLAKSLRLGDPADAYICALLSGIGRLAFATVHPVAYSDLMRRVGPQPTTVALCEAEAEVFDIHHLEIAQALLADWNLPEAHGQAITSYVFPTGEDQDLGRVGGALRSILRVATPVASILVAEEGNWHTHWPHLDSGRQCIDLAWDRLNEICDEIKAEWCDWGRVLAVPTFTVPPFGELLETLNEQRDPGARAKDDPFRVDDIDATALAQPQLAAERLTVLVVDDDPVSRKLLTTHLKQSYDVVEATNGEEGLRIALEKNPHIVVSDWIMPEMDGLELTRSLRRIEIGQDMYILVLTGREEEENVIEAFDAGVDDFVTKPFNPRLLLSRVAAGERLVRLNDKVGRDKKMMEQHVAQLAVLNRKLSHASKTDALTDLPNRRYAMTFLGEIFERRDPVKQGKLSVIMIDIDHFKLVNDTYGHEAGDVVLRQLAHMFRSSLRRGDAVCRLGGEEFVVVCPGSDHRGAKIVAERLRKAVEETEIRYGESAISMTCSFGVAERTDAMESQDDLLRAADVAVYEAKEAGRNQVCVADTAVQAN